MEYIRNHWLGNHSLLLSFWVNLVGLRIAILFFERFTHPPYTEQSTLAVIATLLYFVIFQIVIFTWQVRGLLKASDRDMLKFGAYSKALFIQAGIVGSLLISLFVAFAAFQSLFEDPAAMFKNRYLKSAPLLGEYSLTLEEKGTRIDIKGDFSIGLTKALKTLLEQNLQIKSILFSSSGGRVTEGRGVAKLVKKYKLDTYVYERCSSACVTAFIGGVGRYLGVQGRLGFHQFSINSLQKTPYIDPKAEQKIDLAFYIEQKIDPIFLQKVFRASHSEIWFPTTAELLSAGVIHQISKK